MEYDEESMRQAVRFFQKRPLAILVFVVLIYYLPIFKNPQIFLERGNDLGEFFWPVFYFVKQQILINHTLPLWNNLFFSGMPLLADPQSPLFYPPNIIFLLLPVGAGFISSFIIHTVVAGAGAYSCARLGLRFSRPVSSFCGILFMTTPKLAGYLEAGHFGLVTSWAWLPFALLAVIKLVRSPKITWSVVLGISLAGIFYTHLLTFIIVSISISLLWLFLIIEQYPKGDLNTSFIHMPLAGLLTFGLVAIALLPQLEWKDYTTRSLLLENRDVYPKWTSLNEFLQTILVPWTYKGGLGQIDTEKWLALGITPSLLSIFGFFFLKRKLKIIITLAMFIVVLISLNNVSPLYPLFLSLDWYVLARVATRIWFIPTLLVIFLAGLGLDRLTKQKKAKGFVVFLVILVIGESLLLSWARILKPSPSQNNLAPQEVYEYLKGDKDRFRVFCTTRCLSQKQAAINNLQLVEGYNTLQQINYFKHSWGLMGGSWNYYTLAVPPVGAYKFEELQPDAVSLGEYNTKYIVSPYELKDRNFILEEKFGEYLVYRNSKFLPRAYFWTEDQKPGSEAKILSYFPNKIRVDTSLNQTTRLVLAEVWSPGWKAYLDGEREVAVQEKPDTLRLVDIKPETNFVDFRYEPKSYTIGRVTTILTLLIILGVLVRQRYIH